MRTIRWIAALLALAIGAATSQAGQVIWCETELFNDLGGWVNDAQFIDQMGSPFLLSIGLEKPVADAVTKIDVAVAGKYTLWVRNHDWLPEFSPGRFQVVVGGKPVEQVFGQSKKKGWVWEDGGMVELPAGKVEVRLRDLTGHYGRCDAIVFAQDAGWTPPADLKQIAAARIAHGGVSREVKRVGPYDTVVVGGGLAGTFAAVSAARMGCRTALVQNRPVLGGNGSSEVLVRPEGDTTRDPLDPGEGGIIEEVRGSAEGYSDRMLKVCQAQPNLDLYLNTHVTGVEKSAADRIAAVEGINVTTKQRFAFAGDTFIDCTGDGAVGVWAGAEWRHGREPRSMYNETRAPETGDMHTMGGTLRYATEKMAQPVEFKPMPWARHFDNCSDFNIERHPKLTFGGWQWVIEFGGMKNTYADAEEIRDELLRIIWGMWDHAKNHCPKLAAESPNYKLTWVSYVVGKRESRRLIGDYVMTEHDIDKQTLFPDRVSYAGWGIDIHPPGGFYDTEPPAVFSHKVKFSVPFRSLYSKDISNLMMAGRCISVSHAALGATRVMITCGLQGQAVGTAAGICKMHQATPRAVYQNYINDLQQQLLKDGCYLIDLPNQDPADLARKAVQVTASSQSPPIVLEMPADRSAHPMGAPRAVMFKTQKDRIGTVAVYLISENREPTKMKLGLRAAPAFGEFDTDKDLAKTEIVVPKRFKGWITAPLNVDVKPGFHYLHLSPAKGVSWALFKTAPAECMRAWKSNTGWNPSSEVYRFLVDPKPGEVAEAGVLADATPEQVKAQQTMFAPANVIDGFARAIRAVPHSWRPDPKQPLPQWIELDFGQRITFNTVHVAFQAKWLRADDFRIEVSDGAEWRPVAEVTENFDRRRIIRFEPTSALKLRLVVTKSRPDMAVCEIRVYNESARP